MSAPDDILNAGQILNRFEPSTGELGGVVPIQRRLSDVRGCYLDVAAYESMLQAGDPLLYTVANIEPAHGPGALHYAIGRLLPGRVGREYFMTKGHYHAWREAAEVYIGVSGSGMMLLEDEEQSRPVPLRPNHVVYVPGHTAHRTMNIGTEPLIYLGIYPAGAGHDYGAVAKRNFRKVLLDQNGEPTLLDRDQLYA